MNDKEPSLPDHRIKAARDLWTMDDREPLITPAEKSSSYRIFSPSVVSDQGQASGDAHHSDNEEKGHQPVLREPQENHHPPSNNAIAQEEHPQTPPRSRFCGGVVCIEIPAFLYFVSIMNATAWVQYYLTDRMYEEYGRPNVTDQCGGGGGEGGSEDGNGMALSDLVQGRVATYVMAVAFMFNFPAILPPLLVGSFSDRKTAVYLAATGSIVCLTMWTLVSLFHWPLEYLCPGALLEGCTGTNGVFVMATFSIAADVTREGGTRRAFKIATVEASVKIGTSAGLAMAGYWLKACGYVVPMLFSIGLQVIVVLFFLFLIPETTPRPRKPSPVTCSILLRSGQVFLQPGKRCFLLTTLLAFTFGVFTIVGHNVILILYLLAPPFCWTQTHISLYTGGYMLTSWLAVLTLTASVGRRVGDDTLALVGALSGMAGFIFQGLAESDLFLYLGAGTMLLAPMTWPMLRSLMSKSVDAQDQGALFAGIAVMEMLAATVTGVVSPALYRASLGRLHGLPFLCFAGLDLFIAVCLLFLIVRRETGEAKNRAQ